MYFNDVEKILATFLILLTISLMASPFFFENYEIVVSQKPVEVLEQEDLLARISSLESDNEDLIAKIAVYPPEPVNYSGPIIFLGFCAVMISLIFLLYWNNLREKELKILQDATGKELLAFQIANKKKNKRGKA